MAFGFGFNFGFSRRDGAAEKFLDLFPNTEALYSLLQESSTPMDVIRVRRNSDNTEQDFSPSEITNGTLLDFVVPTAVQALYDNAMYFDGVDDTVIIGTPVITDPHNFDIEFTVVGLPPTSSTYTAYGQGNSVSNATVFVFDYETVDNGKLRVFIRNDANAINVDLTANSVSLDGTEHVLRVINVSGTVTIYLDGVVDGTTSYTPSGTFTMDTGRIGSLLRTTPVSFFKGTIYDLHLRDGSGNILASYDGYGITNADWVDTAGSNNATVSGSPALYTGQDFNGRVVRWYDQSGNARNAVQTTAANQPFIIRDGALHTVRGKPFPWFGTNAQAYWLQTASFTAVTAPTTKIAIARFDAIPGGANTAYITDGSTTARQVMGIGAGDKWRIFSGTVSDYTNIPLTNTPYLVYGLFNGAGDEQMYINGQDLGTKQVGTANLDRITIGAHADTAQGFMDGSIGFLAAIGEDAAAYREDIEEYLNPRYGDLYVPVVSGLTFAGEADRLGASDVSGVTQWFDQSTEANHLVRDGATTFTYDASEGAFVKDTNRSVFENMTDTFYGTALTMIVFGKLEAGRSTTSGQVFGLVNSRATVFANADTELRYAENQAAGNELAPGTYDLTDRFYGVLRITGLTEAQLRVNNNAYVTFNPDDRYDDAPYIRIGSLNDVTNGPEGEFYAAFVYNRALTDAEISKVVAYGVRRGFF